MKQSQVLGVAALCLAWSVSSSKAQNVTQDAVQSAMVEVKPARFEGFLRNPLMGFVTGAWDNNERYAQCTLVRPYIKWNEIEDHESDGIEKIRAFCDAKWKGLAARNIKVIPRVYLHWSRDDEKYWPRDLQSGDYESPNFKRRLVRLIERLGTVWDNDPRVAWVQMGLIGKWGEHHAPSISPELQKLMGDAFARSFRNKPVLIRNPWDFPEHPFGIYWDSFAHADRNWESQAIAVLGERWKSAPIGGETAYDWGRFREQPGDSPDDTLSDAAHRDNLISHIRQLHTSHLGWIADYDRKNAGAVEGALSVQKAFGYRFVLGSARFPAAIAPNTPLQVWFEVRNEGSTPLYARWPVKAFLLDAASKKAVWSSAFAVDPSTWQPGQFWSPYENRYKHPAGSHRVSGRFVLPNTLRGNFVLALAICDPAGGAPSARFASANYFNGGYHPIGRVAISDAPEKIKAEDAILDAKMFDDPDADFALGYAER